MSKILNISALALKYFLGAMFIFSALSKFIEIDLLNIYIFSFNIFSLNLSIILGWLLISFELVLGVALLSNRHHRWVCVGNLLLLIAFTLFLIIAQLLGRTDNCHCMGDLLPFSPVAIYSVSYPSVIVKSTYTPSCGASLSQMLLAIEIKFSIKPPHFL